MALGLTAWSHNQTMVQWAKVRCSLSWLVVSGLPMVETMVNANTTALQLRVLECSSAFRACVAAQWHKKWILRDRSAPLWTQCHATLLDSRDW